MADAKVVDRAAVRADEAAAGVSARTTNGSRSEATREEKKQRVVWEGPGVPVKIGHNRNGRGMGMVKEGVLWSVSDCWQCHVPRFCA